MVDNTSSTLSVAERLAVAENNFQTLKESQGDIKVDMAVMQKEIAELKSLVRLNNSLLGNLSDEIKKTNEKSDFLPKAILTAIVTLGVGLIFSQNVMSKQETPPIPIHSVTPIFQKQNSSDDDLEPETKVQ